jgi:nucleotide-binding universal stress UspA family protein
MPSKLQGRNMAGTIVCVVKDSLEGRAAAQVASAISQRLDLRLVLVHALPGLPRASKKSLSQQLKTDARRALEKIAPEARGPGGPDIRIEIGDGAELLAQVAAEEGADLIVLGSCKGGFGGRQLRCPLARELEATTRVPVLIAPPQTRKRSGRRLSVADKPASR